MTGKTLRMYDLAPSPNNMKVRIALNYKELPFERIPVAGQDREAVVKASGQPLTPVLLHGDTVVYDSASILRYLDGNFRDTRPLFSSDYGTMSEIEDWEAYGRRELLQPIGMVFGQFFAAEKDPKVFAEASRLMHEGTARVEERLASADWLVGSAMTAADVTAAPAVYYAMLPPAAAAANPIAGFFAASLSLGDGRDRTRAWVTRVMAYDR